MSATSRAAAIVLCLLAPGACRKSLTPRSDEASQTGATVDRGPVIDSHTLIVPLDEQIDTALKLFQRVGVVKFCNKNGGFFGSRAFAATLRVKHRLKSQFEFFVNVSWDGVNDPDWTSHRHRRRPRRGNEYASAS